MDAEGTACRRSVRCKSALRARTASEHRCTPAAALRPTRRATSDAGSSWPPAHGGRRPAVRSSDQIEPAIRERHQGAPMTASFAQPRPIRRGPSVTVGVVVSLVVGVASIVLAVAGLTFIGLAIAFPIAVPVAQAHHVPVSPADAALAQRFAGLWWAFL